MPHKTSKPRSVRAADWNDVDSPPLTDDFLKGMKPVRRAAPELVEMQKSRGRPRLENPRIAVKLRLASEVVNGFKAQGAGWQTRINAVLQDWLASQQSL